MARAGLVRYTLLMPQRHVYGPVPSRRLGLSLGVDLVPHKACCYDCTYCQVGPTTRLTLERQSFYDPLQIVHEIELALEDGPRPEIISLAGSGEPTLEVHLAELVRGIRRVTSLPLALITNGALLWQEEVARECQMFDLVLPSLDAADEETFARINRPCAGLSFSSMLGGLEDFIRTYQGICRLEIMLVRGLNDSPESLYRLAALARSLPVAAVDLNTVVRPPAHDAPRLEPEAMAGALRIFDGCPASIIAEFRADSAVTRRAPPSQSEPTPKVQLLRQQILETVARRPCTLADLCAALGEPATRLEPLCQEASSAGQIVAKCQGGALYYVAVVPVAVSGEDRSSH
jgi:wyosine [tRNA(Phe)-imidazoG37] synthetase (radical SAM superfamily)